MSLAPKNVRFLNRTQKHDNKRTPNLSASAQRTYERISGKEAMQQAERAALMIKTHVL